MTINKVVYDGTTLMDISDSTVTADTLLAGQVAYDKDGERIVGTMVPYHVGEVKLWAGGGGNIPDGWLFCFGQELSRTDYADLFSAIGTYFGDGDGSTTFNLPDFRDRFPMSAGLSYARGVTGGASTVTLTENQIPAHTHKVNWTNYNRNSASPSYATVGTISSASQTNNANTGSTGGGAAHENKPPFLTIYFIIYTGVES